MHNEQPPNRAQSDPPFTAGGTATPSDTSSKVGTPRPRWGNAIGFVAFCLFSLAGGVGLFFLVPNQVCEFLKLDLVWASRARLALIVVFVLLAVLWRAGADKTRLSRIVRRFKPEHLKDVYIVVCGTITGLAGTYAVTKSRVIAIAVGILSFAYFFYIQMHIRWSRSGLKFVPTWQQQQTEVAQKLLGELRTGTRGFDRSYCLFLRPFGAIPHEYNPYRDEYVPVEERIAEVFQVVCPVIAVGRELTVGPGYVAASSDSWQADVKLLMEHAAVIIVLPDDTNGMRFEIGQILKSNYLNKTLFIAPPKARATERWDEQWEQASHPLREAGLEVPAYCATGIVFYYEVPKRAPTLLDMRGDVRGLRCTYDFVSSRLTALNPATPPDSKAAFPLQASNTDSPRQPGGRISS